MIKIQIFDNCKPVFKHIVLLTATDAKSYFNAKLKLFILKKNSKLMNIKICRKGIIQNFKLIDQLAPSYISHSVKRNFKKSC